MKKIYITLVLFLFIARFSNAQVWPHLGTPGLAVNPDLLVNNADILVVSETEIYVAIYQYNLAGASQTLKVNKYNGTDWISMGEIDANNNLGFVVLRKSPNDSLFIAYSKLNQQNIYEVIISKFDGSNWLNVATKIPLPSSISYFDFLIDNNNIPIVLGSKSYVVENSRISKFVNNSWTHLTIPNSAGSTFNLNSSFVDSQNNLIYFWAKTQFLNGKLLSTLFIDTLNNSTFSTGVENINTNTTSFNSILKDGNNKITILNRETLNGKLYLKFYNNISGTWQVSTVDSANWNSNQFDMNGDGQIVYLVSPNQIYAAPNYTTPICVQSNTPIIYKLKTFGKKVYAIVNNGLIIGDLNTTSTNIVYTKNLNFDVYPNPTTNNILLKGIAAGNVNNIEILSLQGELLLVAQNSTHINVEKLLPGLYFVKLKSADGKIGTAKFIKQ